MIIVVTNTPNLFDNKDQLLGIGLYTTREAARYARIPSAVMLSRWVHGTGRKAPVMRPQLRGDAEKTVTFLDFAQAMAIRAIRVQEHSRIPLQKIRDAIAWLGDKHGVEYPLARRHKIIVFGDELWIDLEDFPTKESEGQFALTTGHRGKDQTMIREVSELFLKDMDFHEGGLASSYKLYHSNGSVIAMTPSVNFGQPMMACGYSLDAVLDAYRNEGSTEAASQAYGIDPSDIELALACNDYLGLPVAAA